MAQDLRKAVLVVFCLYSNFLFLTGQDILKKINYFNHKQTIIEVDHFNEIWLTSTDINDDDIEGLLERANEKIKLDYYFEALEDLDKAIAVDSSIAYTYTLKGLCNIMIDSVEKAVSNFHTAIDLDSSDVLSHYYLGTILLSKNEIDSAKILLKTFNKNFPDNSFILYGLANIYLSESKPDKAIRYFKKSAEINPEFPEAWYSIGLIKLMMYDTYNANRFFEKTIKYNSDFAPAYYMKGILTLFKNNSAKTLEYWNKAIDLDKDNDYYRISRAILKFQNLDYHGGILDIKYVYGNAVENCKVFQDFSDNWESKESIDFQDQFYFFNKYADSLSKEEIKVFENYLGNFLLKKNKNAESILLDASYKNNSSSLLYFFRGVNAEHLRKYKEAEKYYQLSLERSPFIYANYLRLGIIQAGLNNYEKAINNFNKFLEYNDTLKITYRYRGISYFQTGKYIAALEDFNNYFSLDSFDLDLTFNKGMCYKILQEFDKAIEQFDLILDNKKYDDETRYQKAECYFQLNQLDSALACLDRMNPVFFTFHSYSYILRGKIHLSHKEYSNALYDFKKASSIEPRNIQLLYLISLCHKSMKNYTELINTYNRMIDVGDSSGMIYYLRAILNFTLGNVEEGCQDLDYSLGLGYEQAELAKKTYCGGEN